LLFYFSDIFLFFIFICFFRKENEPEVIYLKHVERSAAQQRREVEETTRYPAPTFMTPLRDLSIVEGEKVHFDAKVAPVGDPSMKVEWFCNGKAIAASKFRLKKSVPKLLLWQYKCYFWCTVQKYLSFLKNGG
jgi:hypothetical protein